MTPSSLRNGSSAGSLPSGEPVYLVVGKLHRPHGVQGEISLEVLTDFPERLKPGVLLYVGEDHRPLILKSRRTHAKGLLVTFEGFTTPEGVGELRNLYASVLTADRPALPEGEFYHHQILGLKVVTRAGQPLGTVRQILETGANEVYVIQPEDGPEILVPAIDEVVIEINLEQGQMVIEPIPGLLPGT